MRRFLIVGSTKDSSTYCFVPRDSTMGEKIVETLNSNRVTSANKTVHTTPFHSKLGCLLFSTGNTNSDTTLHRGMREGKIYFLLLKSVKRQKAP